MVSPNPFYGTEYLTLDNPGIAIAVAGGLTLCAMFAQPYVFCAMDKTEEFISKIKTEYGLDGKCYEP